MRIAVVYDCLYPHTIGGVERWYEALTQRLAATHRITYVTRQQWADDETPVTTAGVTVVAVSRGRQLYTSSGRRSITAPLRFGWGVFWHLLRHRSSYDVVHTCAFPYFALIAARLACACGGPVVVTDWFEVWSDRYWVEYLGPIAGRVAQAVQRLCVRLSGPALVFSTLHADRLRRQGYRGEPTILTGAYAGPAPAASPAIREPVVVYMGRHIREKRVACIPAAIALARHRIPGLRAAIFGDGPERERVVAEVERLNLGATIACPGFAPWDEVESALCNAMCLVLPSQREGYGLVVVEASSRGTPSIVTRAPDNAACELIENGQNGIVVESNTPHALADALVAVHAAGPELVQRTRAWFHHNRERLRIEASIVQLQRVYNEATRRQPAPAAAA
jgi:glycosyltransferase involved in cell wall biosynthesis